MFFNARTYNFPSRYAGRYLDLGLARRVQAASERPACLITGLKAVECLWQYYCEVRRGASLAVIHARQRQLMAMSVWIMGLYIKAAKYNYPINLKAKMRASRAWRERVLAELGGEAALQRWEAALQRWEARLSKAVWAFCARREREAKVSLEFCSKPDDPANDSPDNYYGHPDRFEDIPVRRSHLPRMDSKGHFRLAPLPRIVGAKLTRGPRRWRRHSLEAWSRRSPPVPVYPHELRAPPPERPRGYHLYLHDLNLQRLHAQECKLALLLTKQPETPNSASYLLRPT